MSAEVSDVAEIPRFSLRSGATWADPYPMYAALRQHSPVHHVEPATDPGTGEPDAGDYWVLTRHADVLAAANDATTFSSAQGLTVAYGELDAIGMADHPPMVMQDPPTHTAFRRLVSRGFTPRQVVEIEPKVREFVVERLERLPSGGPADIVGELFKPLPSMVVAHYLGVPEEDWSRFDGWTEAVVGATSSAGGVGGMDAAAESAGAATLEMLGYFSELVDYRKRHPADDTVSQLVAAGLADDPENPHGLLSIMAFTFTMVAGGNDTTTGMLGGSVALLHRFPEERQRLVDDPGLIPGSVDELLRLTSPVQGLARTTSRDVHYPDTPDGGATIPAGRKVLLCYGSANRDPSVYGPDADELDVTRRPRNILTFSHGNHHCLGAAAARMQARVALAELLARHPRFTVDVDGIQWADGNYVRRPTYVGVHV
ncbi:cytochrome P450 [Gordonia sp. ABSL11-1]|uniref:cytochrome P450 n=1 Tax=Gordonia sp. ABSL11-1 TaxID=3053924 RepID=UPI002572BC1B|nr:cytochrome P450 [Gordonia sp. ABSL11-1]MDL9945187.1 cytochrome P450 [Gordonia sp. ABSL11-1]